MGVAPAIYFPGGILPLAANISGGEGDSVATCFDGVIRDLAHRVCMLFTSFH